MELIDKDVVVAKLNNWRDEIVKYVGSARLEGRQRADAAFEYELLGTIRDFIDHLEVKEVGLTEEVERYIEDSLTGTNPIYTKGSVSRIVEETAKHFFELGLKAKGE